MPEPVDDVISLRRVRRFLIPQEKNGEVLLVKERHEYFHTSTVQETPTPETPSVNVGKKKKKENVTTWISIRFTSSESVFLIRVKTVPPGFPGSAIGETNAESSERRGIRRRFGPRTRRATASGHAFSSNRLTCVRHEFS